jgi:hypothetical protein
MIVPFLQQFPGLSQVCEQTLLHARLVVLHEPDHLKAFLETPHVPEWTILEQATAHKPLRILVPVSTVSFYPLQAARYQSS